MPTFSLIVPTLERTDELRALFSSIARQQSVSIEVIVVDQNDDHRVDPLLRLLGSHVAVHHLRLARKNASLARNVGLAKATGEFVAFPDDDCSYPADLLRDVTVWFRLHDQYDILAVGAQDEFGFESGNRWVQRKCDIRPHNALRTTFCNSLFLKREALPAHIHFDAALLFGEETDYILRLMKEGMRGRLDRRLFIYHPRRDMLSGNISHRRALSYGEGMGALVRRHSLFAIWVLLMTYELARVVTVAIRGDRQGTRFCLTHARGLLRGFLHEPSSKLDVSPF